MKNGSFRIFEAEIRPKLSQWNSRCTKRCQRRLGIGDPQRNMVRLAQRFIATGLKERQLRAVGADADKRHSWRFMLDVKTQDLAKPGHCTRQIPITNADMIYTTGI